MPENKPFSTVEIVPPQFRVRSQDPDRIQRVKDASHTTQGVVPTNGELRDILPIPDGQRIPDNKPHK